jgi:WD40 repeat protein
MMMRMLSFPATRLSFGGLLLVVAGAAVAATCPGDNLSPDSTKSGKLARASAADLEPVVQIGHSGVLDDVVFSPDGKHMLTTKQRMHRDDRADAILWDVRNGERVRSFSGKRYHLKPVFCLDGRAVLLGKDIWEVETGKRLLTLLEETEAPRATAVSSDTRQAIVAATAGKIRVVDLASGETIAAFARPSARKRQADAPSGDAREYRHVKDVAFALDGTPLAILPGRGAGLASIWNVTTGALRNEFPCPRDFDLRFDPYARYVIARLWEDSGAPVDTTSIHDLATGEKLVDAYEWSDDPDSVKFTADGRYCATGTSGRKAELWDLKTGKKVRDFAGQRRPPLPGDC